MQILFILIMSFLQHRQLILQMLLVCSVQLYSLSLKFFVIFHCQLLNDLVLLDDLLLLINSRKEIVLTKLSYLLLCVFLMFNDFAVKS